MLANSCSSSTGQCIFVFQLTHYRVPMMYFYELIYLCCVGYQVLAPSLLLITVLSAFIATRALYNKRVQLFVSVGQQRLIPMVHRQHVRWATYSLLLAHDLTGWRQLIAPELTWLGLRSLSIMQID